MALDVSPTTGEQFYSGDWEKIKDVLRILDLGEGKMSQVNQPMVNRHQETVDREIDAILEDTNRTPFLAMNKVQPNGTTKAVFPGDLVRCARWWTAGVILQAEFQQLENNMTDQATEVITSARRQLFAMKRFTHRIPGQQRKSHLSHTLPPNLHPPAIPEQDF